MVSRQTGPGGYSGGALEVYCRSRFPRPFKTVVFQKKDAVSDTLSKYLSSL